MALDRLYILTAFVWLIVGMAFGIYIGVNELFAQGGTHAHLNLLGFVISALFGLMYRAWPALQTGRLGLVQYLTYQVGTVLLVIGKYQVVSTGDSAVIAPGAIITLVGTAMMMWIFVRGSIPARSGPAGQTATNPPAA